MSKQTKEFQRATADRIEEIFRGGRQKRVLLADEVGLGKTIIAKEVIDRVRRMRREVSDDMFRVVYVCSNVNIVHQNTKNLGMELLNISESRLSMQHLVIQEKVNLLKKGNRYREDGNYADGEMPELLIPLTPGTSFTMSQGAGNLNERALMLCIVRRLDECKDYPKELYHLFKYYPDLNEVNWKSYIDWYDRRIDACGEKYMGKMAMRFGQNAIYQKLQPRLWDYLMQGKDVWKEKTHLLGQLRIVFAQISIEELEPDLVIMDEFQRFSSLVNDIDNDKSEQAMLTRRFFKSMGDGNAPYILLLSATPYKPFTTLEELNEESVDAHYQDFMQLTDFLFTGQKAKEFHQVWHDYSLQLSQLNADNFDLLIASKQKAEEELYGAMCRTERLMNSLIDMTTHVEEEDITSGDILSYCQMQKLLRDCKEKAERKGVRVKYNNVPMEYAKSSPYLLSFMENYVLKKYIMDVLHPKNSATVKLPFSTQAQKVALNFERIYRYKPLESNNVRLERLRSIMFSQGAECLLWIPASHPYYKTSPDNVFERNADFSKMLVFSMWEMVPRMISFMMSYEAERLTIGQYKGKRGVPTYTNSVGENPLRRDRELLYYYDDYLRDLYQPKEHYGKDIAEIQQGLAEKMRMRIRRLQGFIVEDETVDVQAITDIAQWLNQDVPTDKQVPSHAIPILVNMAIASPAIVLYRRLGSLACTISRQDEKKGTVPHSALEALVGIFNMRQSVGIMSQVYGNERSYVERVLEYSVAGNLQSVIDEYIHMIDETGENKEDLAQTILNSIVDGSTMEIDTTEYYRNTEYRRRLRTHYALPYTNHKTDEKNVSRAIDIRMAFNSPFRPFVLTTTSIGQEGLDFHWYCRKIMHWNIPSNPQDMEQREGRINRYKCLAIRRNIAHKYDGIYEWGKMFGEAEKELSGNLGGLIPYWSIPLEAFDNPERIERIVSMYSLSSDRERYDRMNSVLSLYRLTMGQPRQEELLSLFKDLTQEQIKSLLFNLSPIKRENYGSTTKE